MLATLKVGVIGLGNIAQNAYLPILSKMEQVELTTFMSGRVAGAQKMAARYGVPNVVSSVDEMIASGIDCAFVFSPKEYHSQVVVPLLKNRVDVFCEKPLAMTLTEISQMVEASLQTGSLLMAGFNRRFAPVYQHVKQALGDSVPDYLFGEKNRPDTEFRATMENAIHLVDIFRWFCGECDMVEAHSRYTDQFYELLTTAQMVFQKGSIAQFGAHRRCGQWMEHVEIYANRKNAVIDFPDVCKIVENDKEIQYSMTPLSLGWAHIEDKMGYRNAAKHFLDCVRTRKAPLTCGEDAFKTHELLSRILKSAGLPDLSCSWN